MAGSIRTRLASAVSHLKEAGHYDEAAAVEAVTAPRGYLLLQQDEVRGAATTLTITIKEDLKKALVEAAEEFGVVFSGLAEEAFRMVRDGKWVPPRRSRGKAGTKAVLNVSIDDGLRSQVRAMLPELSKQHGYSISEASIALSHICEELGVELLVAARHREALDMRFPVRLIEHWRQAAEQAGVSLESVVEEKMPALLDGAWLPERPARARTEGAVAPAERERLWLKLAETTVDALRAKAEELTESTGRLVYPGAIVRAMLTDRLGEPAA